MPTLQFLLVLLVLPACLGPGERTTNYTEKHTSTIGRDPREDRFDTQYPDVRQWWDHAELSNAERGLAVAGELMQMLLD